ncbi:hypothetical protein CDL15_Pgr002470 [Punica granatum]|nr:hypothetical protein CDL15_Pgr002470 [Punica granatum]
MLCSAVDTISAGGSISDGETVVSSDGCFELGFFDPENSKRYLGIWYKKISPGTVVWVANRNIPLNDTSGVLRLTNQGILVLSTETKANITIWSSSSSGEPVTNPVARLLETGNLVVSVGGKIVWQSFDYIGDTFLPGMKCGRNLVTGLDNYLTSWKRSSDPSSGEYTNKLDHNGYPQIFLRKGPVIRFRSGPWNGLRFSGMPNLKPNPIYTFEFVYNDQEIYYKYELINSSVVTRMVLNQFGSLQRFVWINRTQDWILYVSAEMDNCDHYSLCGAYGSCNIANLPPCGCLRGFKPKFQSDWKSGDWSNGCVRKTELTCKDGEGFIKIPSVKLPDTRNSWFNRTIDLKECEKWCLRNCSCTAYSSLDIRGGGSGCLIWFNELIDIREYTENGQDLYLRMAASELGSNGEMKRRVRTIIIPVLLGAVIIGVIYVLLAKKKKRLKLGEQIIEDKQSDGNNDEDLKLPLFSFNAIADATNNFSDKNKLGEGGYGPVYKGKFRDGQDIAVKRLSKESKQGDGQFKNEVILIAKLQHRNLVRLLGCCIQGEEKMLVYEYMPNKSLDSFIFDRAQSSLLDWPQRCKIINGIARGLLYLHQDSRLRIIHRDLKASNILLDEEMNAKISDFGMAKCFGGDETEANTRRVVGTYGYMSPEYVIDGIFSVKSDVFSFGVLVLEIINGKRNRGFNHPDHKLNLLGHAWKLFQEGRPEDLMDAPVRDSCDISEVGRSIQVGLLCVQQSPEDRPSMASVVLMLSSDISLPQPKEPGFFTERQLIEGDSSSSKIDFCSTNKMTMTLLTAR